MRAEDGDAYAAYLERTGVAGYAATPGNRGVWVLRRDEDDLTRFTMLTLWDDLDAVRGFAGDDVERAVFYDEDDRFLVEREERATHHVVAAHVPAPPRPADEAGGPGGQPTWGPESRPRSEAISVTARPT